ncbi:Ribonuclease 3 [Spatholobus suberectus]|nr:Ribonuclease 3 [Spatholobus suberectus]
MLAALVLLPTTWLRSTGAMAYVSFGGVLVSIILIGCVVWVGGDGVGFHERGQLVDWKGLLPAVMIVCFVASTITNASIAVLGYTMFGDDSMSQITLNLPSKKISTKIAIYTTIINPFTKYAVLITPIANAIEDKWLLSKRKPVAIMIRTIIVLNTLLVALFMPFYEYIMAFVGAFSCVAISLLFPCLCYLKINEAARRFGLELIIIITILLIGIKSDGNLYSVVNMTQAIKQAIWFAPGITCNTNPSGSRQLNEIFLCVDKSSSNFIEFPILPKGLRSCTDNVEFPIF